MNANQSIPFFAFLPLVRISVVLFSLSGASLKLDAAISPIQSVSLGGSDELLTATVGGTAYAGGAIADTAEFALDGQNINSAMTGGAVQTNTQAATGPEYDNKVLTGTAGGAAVSGNIQTGGILQLYWGVSEGGFTDNDSDPDFFVFEDGGNDTVSVRAILSNDTYGAAITIPVTTAWNSIATNGVLTTDTQLTGRTVSGVSFSFTDLKNASGVNLSNGDMIKGIWIGQQGAADFYEVYANVDIEAPNPILQLAASSPDRDFNFPAFETGVNPTRTLRYEVVATDGATVTIDDLVVSDDPAHPADAFTVSSVPAIPVTLNNGESIDVTVTADGSTAGTFSGSLFIDTTSAGGTVSADLWDAALPLSSTVTGPPLLTNGGFEGTPFDDGWNSSNASTTTGLGGSATAALLPINTSATLGQTLSAETDFTVDFTVSVAGSSTTDSFHVYLDTVGGNAIEMRGGLGNILQLKDGGSYESLARISNGATFGFGADVEMMIRIIGRNFGTAGAEYDLAWSDPGGATLVHAATGLTAFASDTAPAAGGITGIRFDRATTTGHSYTIDNVSVSATPETAPAADYQLAGLPPSSDKVVEISGVYPHLAVTSDHLEVGIGAVVPWADRLWAITYGPHLPNGDSTNKLYEVDDQLARVARAESLGGTPANRFIHEPSNQLIIGPHFIDSSRNVRNLPYSSAPGRSTGTAAHLTDPDNRIYMFTMEDGVYDVNVNNLSFITRYPDVQDKGDKFLFGYHGKGAYTGQGNLIVANNGRPNNQGTPLGPSGALARWNGTTYAGNGNSYLPLPAINNNTTYESSNGPVAGQADYIAGWTQDFTVQHCEVTGPGGIRGNPNPATDPVWATGFDAKSVVLRVLEGGSWNTWRLPKASYSHDGSHGWHTEWPRIRQLDPSIPGSPYLMHMHGLFFDFPAAFSSADSSGLAPLCNYYKMPVDYCMFDGRLVMAKNDASKFENSLALRAQSNFWFGQLEDLQNWGVPSGHGSVWLNEAVSNGQNSEAFLVNGFSQRTLHLRNNGSSAVSIEIQTSPGDGAWTTQSTVNVPSGAYTYEVISALPGEWVRLVAGSSSSSLTAFFHMANPYPHASIASVGGDRFAALADIRDTGGHSDGIIRVMAGSDLQLEFASDTGYHRIGGALELQDVANGSAEANLRSQTTLSQEFGSDAASAWIDGGGSRYRVPMLDPLYDSPFLSGWARGEREVVTERKLFNLHGTFYEIPRDNSGGKRRMRPLATHGKRITDFTSWRGLLVLTGVLDDAPTTDSLVRSPSGAALWLGEVDDIWKMGEPRGTGGPWKDTAVSAGQPSDPYLMYGYDRKELTLVTTNAANITVEVDFLADNTWSTYQSFSLAAGETLTHLFPAGFHAHWVRVKSNTSTTATAQFTYGPADQRDSFLDWGRDEGLPTGSGRAALANIDSDEDGMVELFEFLFGTDPAAPNPWPLATDAAGMSVTLRDLLPEDGIKVTFESCTDLESWVARPDLVAEDPDQSGVPPGFTRWLFTFAPGTEPARFVRISAALSF